MALLLYNMASGTYHEKLVAVTSNTPAHATDAATKKVPAMMPKGSFCLIAAQLLWAATMAWTVSDYLKKNRGKKNMQVNGRFHSDEKFAIVTQLENYSPKFKSLVISAGPDDSFLYNDWSKQKHLGE